MRRTAEFSCLLVVLLAASHLPAKSERVMGEVIRVSDSTVVFGFPVPVRDRSLIMILSGRGEAIAGLALSTKCMGDKPPYQVTGSLYLTMDPLNIAAGKAAYVNSLNTTAAPSSINKPGFVEGKTPGPRESLGLYYFAAGQSAGYGAIGLGFEHKLRVMQPLALEFDGGIATVGNISDTDARVVDTDQMIKNLSGRLRFDFGPWFGIYSGYRWNQGRVGQDRWQELADRVSDKSFVAPSALNTGIVESRGIEYGLSVRLTNLTLLAGYVPKFRTDFGSIGVLSEPAYTAELRFGFPNRVLRLRGLRSDNYWIADMGITIR